MSKAIEVYSVTARRSKKVAKKKARKEAKRINDILLGPLERPALAWLAARMPSWVVPDVLTAIGCLAAVVVRPGTGDQFSPGVLGWPALAFAQLVRRQPGGTRPASKIERPRYGFYLIMRGCAEQV